MFSTLPRYFSRVFFMWFCVFLVSLGSIIMLFDFYEMARRASSKSNVKLGMITKMTLLKFPHVLEILLPVVVLFAAMFTLWRLNRQNEICVARAAGLSIWQLLSPFILVALLIGIFDLFALNSLSTGMMTEYRSLKEHMTQNKKSGSSISKSGIWLRYASETGPIVVRVGHVNADEKILSNLTILEYDDKDILRVRIDAESAKFVGEGMLLSGVWLYPYRATPIHYEQLPYSTAISVNHIQDNRREPETISFWNLPSYIELLEDSGLSSVKYRLHFQSLLARVVWLIAMVLLAATCTLRPIRQGRQLIFILPAILLGFGFYFLRDITYAMGQSAVLPVTFAAWSPVAISAMIGLVVLLNLEEH